VKHTEHTTHQFFQQISETETNLLQHSWLLLFNLFTGPTFQDYLITDHVPNKSLPTKNWTACHCYRILTRSTWRK